MTNIQSTLDKIVNKLDDRAIPPTKEELTERFILMKKDTNLFYVISAVIEKEEIGVKLQDLIESELIPNITYICGI